MWDASLQFQPSSEAGRDCCPYMQRRGGLRSPTWPRSQRGRKQEPLEKSALQRHMYSYTFVKKQETLSSFVKNLGGEGSVGKARRGAGHFSKRRPVFHPPVPRAIHEGSEVPSAAGPRGRWRARDRSGSDEDPVAWPQESLHSPHHSPPFMARMDNSPLQIQAACPPREQLAPSLHWEHVPDVTALLPALTTDRNRSQPWMLANQPAPLHNPAVPEGTSRSVASPRWAATSRRSGSAPNTCPRPLPSSTRTLGHCTACCVTAP